MAEADAAPDGARPPSATPSPQGSLNLANAPALPAPQPTANLTDGACPDNMALIQGRFCIDRFEASLESPEGEPLSPYHALKGRPAVAVSRAGLVPQAHISMNQAKAACARAGKRLCTTAQWLEACAGSSKRPLRSYPYGNTEESGACNAHQPGHPIAVLHGGRRKTDSFWMNDPRINQLSATVAPTGAFEGCVSPEGVHDLVGNLLEWTEGSRPLLMGGYYLDAKENGLGCRYVTMLHGADYHDFTTGFRCCAAKLSEAEARVAGSEAPSASGDAQGAEPPSDPSAQLTASTAPEAPPPNAPQTPEPSPDAPRDPPGLRAFTNPAAPLPKVSVRAEYAPADAACPSDMALVEGQRCVSPTQTCKTWVDDPGTPPRSCGEFAPTVCGAARQPMRYCIDRYEFTPEGYTYPLVNVSWGEAELLCRRSGKRLCLEAEWEFACEGPEALPYPYGYKRDGAACNHDRTELFTAAGKLNDQRVPTGSLPRCVSPFGVFNLVGNVDEWTTRGGGGRRSILRGGWWLKGRNRCRAATSSHGENYAGAQTSFRCCKAAR
ncbi:MAG: SUMF1/EgtB/PvdO family nonheme iron enzyme [Polyangiaceae bacterium]|nr:SUMF1/EgtB/PvdO family nonheme iron enzyme [Polyangiaceae bacterium]